MNNYQLYRTNVLLGGQVCWDIILEKDKEQLYTKDLHITPINHNIPFSYLPDKYDMDYPHQYNIKELYKEIGDKFYKSYINPRFEDSHPIISEKEYNTHDQTYEMGCQRIHQDIYGKQFEFFCPVWIEQLSENDVLSFEIQISSKQNRIIAQKNIEFKLFDNKDRHNKIVNYFTNYIKHCQLDKGNDSLLKINLSNKNTYLDGIDITSGNKEFTQNNTLAPNLLFRERPLLEFDSLILNEFKKNYLISKQLFNFRFLFNFEDVISLITYNLINVEGGNFYISIYAKINNTKLPLKDFYTNFEFIPREIDAPIYSTEWNNADKNVLDYLQDYKAIDLLNLNKINPVNIHWSLADSNNYIFNMYQGFAGYKKNIDYEYSQGIAPNIFKTGQDTTWCNQTNFSISSNSNFQQFKPSKRLEKDGYLNEITLDDIINYSDDIKSLLCNEFKKGLYYLNNLKYDVKKEIEPVYVLVGKANADVLNRLKTLNKFGTYDVLTTDSNSIIYLIDNKSRMIIIMTDSFEKYGFLTILKHSINNEINNDVFADLIDILKSVQYSPVIRFNNSLLINKADSPSLDSKEIEYLKNNNFKNKYLLRYDGKLKPTFIDEKSRYQNQFYYKKILKLDSPEYQDYCKLLNTNYEPLYPSLKFYYIEHLPMNYVSPEQYKYLNDDFEYKWFNNNKIKISQSNIILDFSIDIVEGKIITQNEFVTAKNKALKDKLKIDDSELKFYNENYKYTIINDFIQNKKYYYTIKLTLL